MTRSPIRDVTYCDTIQRRPWAENQHLCRLACGHTRTVIQGPPPTRAACHDCNQKPLGCLTTPHTAVTTRGNGKISRGNGKDTQ